MVTSRDDPRGHCLIRRRMPLTPAAWTVQTTTESVAIAIEDSRRPGGVLDQLSRFTRKTPLLSLAIAFAAGLIFARRL